MRAIECPLITKFFVVHENKITQIFLEAICKYIVYLMPFERV